MIDPKDHLYVPKPRALMHAIVESEEGAAELVLTYRETEVAFDDPRFFPLARGLLGNASFAAGDVCGWAEGSPYEWEEAREILEALEVAGILVRAGDGVVPKVPAPRFPRRTSTGAPGVEPVEPDPARTFARENDRCLELSAQAYGVAFDLSMIEAFVPVYRVAHAAFDGDGRQLGEANVRFDALLQPLRTTWAVCNYPGSRYHEGIINATALKHATRCWPETLAVVASLGEVYRERFGLDSGPLGVLDQYCCASLILALPAWLLMREVEPVPSGAIPAPIACAFRIVDGVRFVTEAMMQGSVHTPVAYAPDDRIVTGDFMRFAEEGRFFFSRHGGVCAGSLGMIHTLVDLVVTGRPPGEMKDRDHEADRAWLDAAVGDWSRFLVYAVEGMKTFAAANLFQRRQRELLASLLAGLPEEPAVSGFVQALRGAVASFDDFIAPDSGRRTWAEDLWAKLAGEDVPPTGASPQPEESVVQALARILTTVVPEPIGAVVAPAFLGAWHLEEERLTTLTTIQARLNEAAGRPPPYRPFRHGDLRIAREWALPLGTDAIAEALGAQWDRDAGLLTLAGQTFTAPGRESSGS